MWFFLCFFFLHVVRLFLFFFFFQAEDGIRDLYVTGVQTCALPLLPRLVKSVGGVERPAGSAVPDLPFNTEHIDFIRTAMVAVTTSGTARAFGDLGLGEGIRMAGKTGTAQARGYSGGTGVH